MNETIFSTSMPEDFEEYFRDYILDEPETFGYTECTDETMREQFENENEVALDETKDWLFSIDKPCVVEASLGRWDGTFQGGKILPNMKKVWDTIFKDSSYEDYTIEYDGGGLGSLWFVCYHHDGVDRYQVHVLNDEGIEKYEEMDSDLYEDKDTIEEMVDEFSGEIEKPW